ncbi:MAG: hydrogenase nickel incorporation protein HypB [Chloroflexota bacterium]
MLGSQNTHPETEFPLNLEQLFETHLAAKTNLDHFNAANLFAFHIMGNPGAGKTTLIERTLEKLSDRAKSVVIQGQIVTELDTDRLRLNGTPTVSIVTESSNQLSAEMVSNILPQIQLEEFDLLWIENVGNLLTPAQFPLGTHKNILLVSVTDGEELPLKYPSLFQEADCVLLTKVDLLPHLHFKLGRLIDHIEEIQPGVPIIDLSAESGDGMDQWLQWIIEETRLFADEEVDTTYEKPIDVPFIG